MKPLVLASSSPRRQELIKKLNMPFIVDPSSFEEYFDMGKSPEELTIELSIGKAKDVAKHHPDSIILAADTFVVLEGKYLGKPKDRKDAEEMLSFQSGKRQEVVTGFTLLDTSTEKMLSKAVATQVYFNKLTKEQINEYLNKNTFLDKAGAYAIQEVGDTFIEKIEGDLDNVVGLPVEEVKSALAQFTF